MAEEVQGKLPAEVTDFLDSSELLFKIIEIIEKHKVSEDKYDAIAPVVEGLLEKPAGLDALPAAIQKITELDMTAATRLTADLAGYWLLPLEAYVGDVTGHIMSWGGKIEDYPPKRIARRAVQPDEFTRETLHAIGAKQKEPTLQHRLEYILTTYVRGVRTAEESIAVLGRSKKVGGLEMDPVKAKEMVDHIAEKMAIVKIDRGPAANTKPAKKPIKKITKKVEAPVPPKSTKPVKKPVAPKSMAKPAPAAPAKPKVAGMQLASDQVPEGRFDAVTISKADEIEAQAAAKKIGHVPKKPVSINKTTSGLVSGIAVNLPDEESKKRFANIASSRLRGIRDAVETRDSLEADPARGGVGLKGKDLADAMEQIERQFDAVEGKLKEEKRKEKEKLLEKKRQAAGQQGKVARAEADILAKRYASITGKAPKELLAPSGPTGSRVSAARGTQAELQAATARIDQDKVKKVVQAAKQPPAPASAELSEVSVTGNGKPRVQDVSQAQRLSGPVDELANVDPTSFRRLSRDPKEAALKIQDKIELLEGQSYAKRLAGVKAWQESPINKLYLSLVQEALSSGISIKEVAKKKTVANEPSLTEDEVKSIMQLNNELKF